MDLALRNFYQRGLGRNFQARREFQIRKSEELNKFICDELRKIQGVKVINDTEGVSFDPSMITFTLNEGVKIDVEELRIRLQKFRPPITLGPIYQKPLLRIGLNELRKQDVSHLIDSIKTVLESRS